MRLYIVDAKQWYSDAQWREIAIMATQKLGLEHVVGKPFYELPDDQARLEGATTRAETKKDVSTARCICQAVSIVAPSGR